VWLHVVEQNTFLASDSLDRQRFFGQKERDRNNSLIPPDMLLQLRGLYDHHHMPFGPGQPFLDVQRVHWVAL
jgi:hypothetical protein